MVLFPNFKKDSDRPVSRAMDKAMDMTIWQSAGTDPQGSYTGTPADPYEVPACDRSAAIIE